MNNKLNYHLKKLNIMADNENIAIDPQDAQDNKIMAILAYLGLLFLVPFLAAKESPFARFHTNQGRQQLG
jgi:hypothetical protein